MVIVMSKDGNPPTYNEATQASMPHSTPTTASTPAIGGVDHYIDNQGCIVCVDPTINSDGTSDFLLLCSCDAHLPSLAILMAQFIREQAQIPPKLIVHIKGSHEETIYSATASYDYSDHTIIDANRDGDHRVSRAVGDSLDGRDRDHHHDQHQTDQRDHYKSSGSFQVTRPVIDFDFKIDISCNVTPEPEYFVIADNLAAYRGQTFMELDLNPGGRHGASNVMQAKAKALEEGEMERIHSGEQPWQTRNAGGSLTLEQWCSDYIHSSAQIKDFKFTKVIHGWDLDVVEAAIRNSITAELYNGKVEINFTTPSGNGIHVRPSTGFSKARSNTFLRGLLNVSLVWPITCYLYEQQWRTCGATYALKKWVHLADSQPGDDVTSYAARVGRHVDPKRLSLTPEGISEIRGVQEDEWFAHWESTVKNAVNENLKERDPLAEPHNGVNGLAADLDESPNSSLLQPVDRGSPLTSSWVML